MGYRNYITRRLDAQYEYSYNRASREEARFREAEWDNHLRHGPVGHAAYHHGCEHCIGETDIITEDYLQYSTTVLRKLKRKSLGTRTVRVHLLYS